MKMKNENPKIICFMCNWAYCQNEVSAPSNVKVVRIPCLGRIDPVIVLDALEEGVYGVMLVGCKPPDCHFVEGNLQAERAVKMLKKLVALSGLEPERIKLVWFTPLNEKPFEKHVREFSQTIRKHGHSLLENNQVPQRIKVNILAAKNAAANFRLRVLLGREKELTESVNVYGEKLSEEEFDKLLDEIVKEEFVRQKIYVLTKTKPYSVKALAETLGMKPADVLNHVVDARRKNMIALDHVEGTTPFYKALEVK